MSVIRTDIWLKEDLMNPLEICKKLTDYFSEANPLEIYQHLLMYGMYQEVSSNKEKLINYFQDTSLWKEVEGELKTLQKLWEGPEIPVFILPADLNNPVLKSEFNGKSGLAFKDKLFLFISPQNSLIEIKTLFTHEYNHVCRLNTYNKQEKDYDLLDTIVLEGLAEISVLERFGEKYTTKYLNHYSDEQLKIMWEKYILPYKTLIKNGPYFYDLLYGNNKLPKMLGYCVGFYLVKKYKEKHRIPVKELLYVPTINFTVH